MRRCISFGLCKCEYMTMMTIYTIIILFQNIVLDNFSKKYKNSKMLDSLLYYIGCSLCLFPLLFKKKFCKSNQKIDSIKKKSEETDKGIIEYIYNNPYDKYLTTKDLIMTIIVSLLILFEDFCGYYTDGLYIYYYKNKNFIKNKYFFIEVIIWFLFSKYFLKTTHYKHQSFSIIGIMIIGTIRFIYIFCHNFEIWYIELINLFIELITIITDSISYGYIKGLMEYKFFSPYKCCYIIGMINFPIILIIYFIVTYTPCYSDYLYINESKKHCKYFDNIFYLFKDVNPSEVIVLIINTVCLGVESLLINMTMNDFSFYHLIIPMQIGDFFEHIILFIKSIIVNDEENNNEESNNEENNDKYENCDFENDKEENNGEDNNGDDEVGEEQIILFIFFILEFFFYLIFLEIIELNCCRLNKNTRKNIEIRAISKVEDEDGRDSFYDLKEVDDENDENLLPDGQDE